MQKSNFFRFAFLGMILMGGFILGARLFVNKINTQRNERFLQAAEESAAAENWGAVQEIAQRWTEWNPDSVKGWLALADANIRLRNDANAAEALSHIPIDHERYLEARALRGDILYLDLQDPYQAVENWQELLSTHPDAIPAHQGLTSFYAFSFQPAKMLNQIRQSIQLRSESKEAYVYLLLADRLAFSDAAFRVHNWLRNYPEDETIIVAEAYHLARHGQGESSDPSESNIVFQGDWRSITEAIKRYPQNLNVLAFQFENAIFDGNYRKAASLINDLPPEAESDHRFWRYRANVLFELSQIDESIVSAKKCLEFNPYDWRSRIILSNCYREKKRLKDAKLQAEIATVGKDMEHRLLALPNPTAYESDFAKEILQYAALVGDDAVVNALQNRGVETDSLPSQQFEPSNQLEF